MKYVNIQTNSINDLSKTLKDMGKNQLPRVVRMTLNDIAFNTKKTTLLESAKTNFKGRVPQFIKWASNYMPAKGNDITKISSAVGILRKTSSTIGNTRAVDNLGKFEYGNKKTDDKIYEVSRARVGGNWNKRVSTNNSISKASARDKWNKVPITKTRGKIFSKMIGLRVQKGRPRHILIKDNVFLVSYIGGKKRWDFKPMYHLNKGKLHTAEKKMFIHEAIDMDINRNLRTYFKKHANTSLKWLGKNK